MEIYLVTLDSTHSERTVTSGNGQNLNQRNFSFKPGIQNFYLIMAPDSKRAKAIVINTFRAKPSVMIDAESIISAVPINAVTKLLNKNQNVWSYIPIGGVRAPGQQGMNSTIQRLKEMERLASDENGPKHTAYQVPPPIVYDNQGISTEKELNAQKKDSRDREVLAASPSNNSQMSQEQMMQQMQIMMQQMQNMQGGLPTQESQNVMTADPESDIELAERIKANSSSRPMLDEPEQLTQKEIDEISRIDNNAASKGEHSTDGRAIGVDNQMETPIKENNQKEIGNPDGWGDDMSTISKGDDTVLPEYE